MNVLILSLDQSLLTPLKVGDSLERFQAYAKYLKQLDVLVPTTNPKAQFKIQKNIHIIPVIAANRFLSYAKLLPAVRSRLHQIDLLVSNDPVLGGIAHLARNCRPAPPLQINVFGASVTNSYWLKERFLNRLYAPFITWALRRADSIRCDSSLDKQALVSKLSLKPENITIIPVPPSPRLQQLFLNTHPNPKSKKPHPHSQILTVAHLVPNKDISNLLKSAALLKKTGLNFTWTIVGDGPLRSDILTQIGSLNLKNSLRLVGQLPYNQLPSLLKSVDLLVSTSYLEGLPRVIMEATLSKTPVVSTATSGVHDLIEDRVSGRIVPVKDPQALALAIQDILAHPQKAKSFAHIAHAHALKYLDFDKNVTKLINSWRKLTHD